MAALLYLYYRTIEKKLDSYRLYCPFSLYFTELRPAEHINYSRVAYNSLF